MNGAVVRRTQESLGRVIRKPPLTDRLLSKPPFRYLHDVIGEVIRVTGFMNGLYTDFEMKSDNVKDKDAKISFLQKAIDVVIMVTGEPLSVKPARIVAGHEPERTNEFLQAIGKCCLNKLSSDDAVKRVLAGEKADIKGKPPSTSKSQDKENRESRAEEQKSHKDKEGRGDNEIKDRSTSRDRKPREELKEEEKKQKEKERDKHKDNEDRHKDLEADNFREDEKHERERSKNRTSKQGRETEKSRDKEKGDVEREKDLEHDKGQEKERKNEGGKEKEKLKERDKEKGRDKDREKDRDRGKERERDRRRERGKDGERLKERGTDKAEKKSTGSEDTLAKKTERSSKDTKTEPDKESGSPARIPRQSSTKGPRQRVKPGAEGSSFQLIRSPPAVRRKESKNSAASVSTEKKLSPSYMKARKDTIVKQLGRKEASKTATSALVEKAASILKEKAESVTTMQEPGVLETNSPADNVSDEKAASILHAKAEPRPAIKHQGESASDAEGEAGNRASEKPMVSENGEVSNDLPPHVTQRRPPRPNSARPAPPRIKRQESAEVLLPERNGSGKAVSNVIIDKKNSDDEDDQFVVEAAPQLPEMPEMETEPIVELDGDEKHGGLVKRILETKRDYETSQQSKSTEKEKPLLSEAARRKEKDLVSKEIEKFRASIQTLCRSALPLGKIMDYIQEDMDSMKNELQMWQHENKQHAEALQKEQSITDSAVEPLKADLAELEQLIKDQQDKICTVKANVLKKEEKIRKMVLNINLSMRR
ncbi:TRAF3-interacting protein 1 isoform X6 [Trachemys scripta elegans]|uniref:TRAF3-interacting protein 1 isoform X6 n=1 Tax=Trachemys scripta elegans TaxID=31138 RepID=UPI001555DAB7|nr:TRAF3-interacting protein 1 isoform X6 [Trachemys scripta elegans]